jgi:hypothetical protein
MASTRACGGRIDHAGQRRINARRLQGRGLGGQLLDELRGHLAVDQDAVGRHADLALVEEGGKGGRFDRGVEVGVVEHDDRVLAAQFQQHRLQVPGRLLGDDAADLGRAGKVNAAHGRVPRSGARPPARHPAARC